jgi:porphobilinogen synthase
MTNGQYPSTRMRRIRLKGFARDLCRETTLSPKDLVLPLFVLEGENRVEPVESMPGVFRYSIDNLILQAKKAHNLGIPAIALFPVVSSDQKSLDAKAAWNPHGLVPEAIKALKKELPTLGVITDIALDPYTSHGQDGLINSSGEIMNDETVEALVNQALCHARAGADVVAPSDMMDGRIAAIRNALESNGFKDTMILAYSAKYASSFYGPFRDAVGSKLALGKASKHSYQMDPGNREEALREIALDIEEGADMVMVKPGLPYLDIVRSARDRFQVPIFVYNVSGEYAMVKAAANHGWIDEKRVVIESMLCFKRAGAQAILTYHAMDVAAWIA